MIISSRYGDIHIPRQLSQWPRSLNAASSELIRPRCANCVDESAEGISIALKGPIACFSNRVDRPCPWLTLRSEAYEGSACRLLLLPWLQRQRSLAQCGCTCGLHWHLWTVAVPFVVLYRLICSWSKHLMHKQPLPTHRAESCHTSPYQCMPFTNNRGCHMIRPAAHLRHGAELFAHKRLLHEHIETLKSRP